MESSCDYFQRQETSTTKYQGTQQQISLDPDHTSQKIYGEDSVHDKNIVPDVLESLEVSRIIKPQKHSRKCNIHEKITVSAANSEYSGKVPSTKSETRKSITKVESSVNDYKNNINENITVSADNSEYSSKVPSTKSETMQSITKVDSSENDYKNIGEQIQISIKANNNYISENGVLPRFSEGIDVKNVQLPQDIFNENTPMSIEDRQFVTHIKKIRQELDKAGFYPQRRGIHAPAAVKFNREFLKAGPEVLDMLTNGYKPKFTAQPPPPSFKKNNRSATSNIGFVRNKVLRYYIHIVEDFLLF